MRGGCKGHARDHVRPRVHRIDAHDPEGHGRGGHDGDRPRGRQARRGDLFVLCYSGHGGQVRDPSGEEADWEDETWVLWDRQLLDDELYALWSGFKPGVRILVLSDSCHSGSVVRDKSRRSPANAATSDRFKFIPRDVQDRTDEAHRNEYEPPADVREGRHGRRRGGRRADLRLPGQPDSRDGDRNGLFTQRLREVWAGGTFAKGHRAFYRAISELMPPDQTPNYFRVGKTSSGFERMVPFTI